MNLTRIYYKIALVMMVGAIVLGIYCNSTESKAANPYLPMWEHIPDGEPYVFEDPENPGQYRLYIYGSHDIFKTKYCGDDLVVWSAPVNDLNNWRYDGVIFERNGDTLYAPDIAVKIEKDGSKTYYLYPNDQNKMGVIAKADSPIGPFEVCNENGVLGFDPAVFVDDDGRVYGYWGFQESNMAELDPETMCTVKSGCATLKETDTNIDSSNDKEGPYRFFEASSIRKVTDNGKTLYAFIYSRKTLANEFDNLGECNATLAYAYSEHPLGPWIYGGTIVDARAREKDESGKTIMTMPWGNTHGSIVDVNGQWYLFYHRCINEDQHSRQGTAEAVDVSITDDGKLKIAEAEVTSQGLEINGLNPYESHSAGIMCYRTGSSYVKATYDENVNSSPVVNNKKGNIVGYKYFNFKREDWQSTSLSLDILAKGIDGTIKVMMDSPWKSHGGKEVGTINVSPTDSKSEVKTMTIETPEIDNVTGKHAVYFVFNSTNTTEIADLCDFKFNLDGEAPPSTPSPVPTSNPLVVQTPAPTAVATPVLPASSATPVVQATAPAENVSEKIIKGAKFKIGKYIYTVTNNDLTGKGTVSITGISTKSIKSIKIADTIKISGKRFKVTSIGPKAFAKCSKLRKITIEAKNLKIIGKNSLKGISVKCRIKVPAGKYAAYKKLLKGKGQNKRVKIIK